MPSIVELEPLDGNNVDGQYPRQPPVPANSRLAHLVSQCSWIAAVALICLTTALVIVLAGPNANLAEKVVTFLMSEKNETKPPDDTARLLLCALNATLCHPEQP
jgi:hypothetical protein